ncbi:type II toxin-antitoxin system VapC family toxin [Acidiferrobacter sp.]|jgi:predicted nucleic-acid-binding protein|uniref:PIN domain-containing protein n=1 Tax=Acidiferrobacter sp. TaxID=1872107 RepID=UPI0026019379|nr:type II toxin-antitoxin system VapC family toxin [Acidiferrobacter sp.]
MLGIDTNVLVRFLVRDDEAQFERARKLIKREVSAGRRVFVNHVVIMETEWVLRSRYAIPKTQVIEALSGLLDAADVQMEDEPTIEQALFAWKDAAADFADCLIGAKNRRLGCQATASFDSKASRLLDFIAV